MAADDGHIHLPHVQALRLRHKRVGPHLQSREGALSAGRCPLEALHPLNRMQTAASSLGASLCQGGRSLLRTTSRVDTPMSLRLLYTPAAFNTSAAMGTVELTGLEMMLMTACRCDTTNPHLQSNGGSMARPHLSGSISSHVSCNVHARQRYSCLMNESNFRLTLGACFAMAFVSVFTMPALMLNRSSRVMP